MTEDSKRNDGWWGRRPTWQKVTIIAGSPVVALVLIAAIFGEPVEESAIPAAPTTTTVADTTTTEPTTTTTTLPPILASGEGRGDDVVEISLPPVPVIVELTHDGNSNYAVWSLDMAFETVDLLVNEIGRYQGTRPMQFSDDEVVTGLEITADGNWTYEIRPLLQEPSVACRAEGSGDAVILLENFVSAGGAVDITASGDSNFAVWAWGASGRDLLVNEIAPYEGTVRVSSGLFIWDISSASGDWSIDC